MTSTAAYSLRPVGFVRSRLSAREERGAEKGRKKVSGTFFSSDWMKEEHHV